MRPFSHGLDEQTAWPVHGLIALWYTKPYFAASAAINVSSASASALASFSSVELIPSVPKHDDVEKTRG